MMKQEVQVLDFYAGQGIIHIRQEEKEWLRLTKEELEEFAKELADIIDSIPAGRLQEKPRAQLTGEIIPESLLKEDLDKDCSEQCEEDL